MVKSVSIVAKSTNDPVESGTIVMTLANSPVMLASTVVMLTSRMVAWVSTTVRLANNSVRLVSIVVAFLTAPVTKVRTRVIAVISSAAEWAPRGRLEATQSHFADLTRPHPTPQSNRSRSRGRIDHDKQCSPLGQLSRAPGCRRWVVASP